MLRNRIRELCNSVGGELSEDPDRIICRVPKPIYVEILTHQENNKPYIDIIFRDRRGREITYLEPKSILLEIHGSTDITHGIGLKHTSTKINTKIREIQYIDRLEPTLMLKQ